MSALNCVKGVAYKVNGTLVAASSIEACIALYKKEYDTDIIEDVIIVKSSSSPLIECIQNQ